MDILTGYEGQFLIGFFLSLAAGFLIGGERESRGKEAGISTHMLVIGGSMIFTFLSGLIDPESKTRIAAQIITGIGFIGAGIIFRTGSHIRNLTTAASIWFSGAIGMAIGFQFYLAAIIATIVCALTPRIPYVTKAKAIKIINKLVPFKK